MSGSHTIKIDIEQSPEIRRFFIEHGFEMGDAPHALWRAKGPGCNVTFYTSGKLLVQGKEADAWRGLLGDVTADARPYYRALARHPDPKPARWVGTDETGKGDYFGPLVIAGVSMTPENIEVLQALGVDDSKALSDSRVPEMEVGIRALCETEVLLIGPEKYNALYAKIGNLNRLMAWAHGRVIENLLERDAQPPPDWILVDRFVGDHVMKRALGPLAQSTRFDQWPKAESDPAVAAASILARGAFLRGLKSLSKRFGVELRPGAGAPTLSSGRKFLEIHGTESLGQVAKLHFATTQQIGG
jgi:ribonuclease HIII